MVQAVALAVAAGSMAAVEVVPEREVAALQVVAADVSVVLR